MSRIFCLLNSAGLAAEAGKEPLRARVLPLEWLAGSETYSSVFCDVLGESVGRGHQCHPHCGERSGGPWRVEARLS